MNRAQSRAPGQLKKTGAKSVGLDAAKVFLILEDKLLSPRLSKQSNPQ